ncbi:autotransporter outer membrane beta-barrel domain-containing protein [Pseudomonas wadenswilerensis]
MTRTPPNHLALQIALIVSGGFAAQAEGVEIVVNAPTSATQILRTGDRLTVRSAGKVQTTGRSVTLFNPSPMATVTVENAGSIISSGARAIDWTDNANTIGNYQITNLAGALIQGQSDAIRINNQTGLGSANFDNAGTITSMNGLAINLDNVKAGTTITNRVGGVIHSNNNDGMTTGSNTTIYNHGVISSGTALAANDSHSAINLHMGLFTSITNGSTGLITGGMHAIDTDGVASLFNSGTMSGRNGAGINSDGYTSLVNHSTGIIIGGTNGSLATGDGDGAVFSANSNVENRGTIIGNATQGTDGNGVAHTSEGVSIGGGVLTNHAGALIRGANNGVLVGSALQPGGAALTWLSFDNRGTIQGLDGYGVKFVGEFNDIAANYGLISGSNGLAMDLGGGADQLNVYAGSHFEGQVDGGNGYDTLSLFASGTSNTGSFGPSRNFESLQVRSGNWTLTGDGDFSDVARVFAQAQLINQGQVTGTLTVDSGAAYAGNGSVGNLIMNGSLYSNTVSGTTRVNGDLDLGSNAQVFYGVNADGSSGTLRASGQASLGDATLWIVSNAESYPWRSEYTVVEAAGIDGRFGQVFSDTYAFLAPELSYSTTHVTLTYTRNGVEFAEYATTPNSASLARSIQPAPPAPGLNPIYDALLYTSPATAGTALGQLAAGSNANIGNALLGSSAQVAMMMRAAIYQMGSGGGLGLALDTPDTPLLAATSVPGELRQLNDPDARGRLWLQGIGGYGRLEGAHGSPDFEQRTRGALLGSDWALDGGWRLGLVGGYSKTSLDSGPDDGKLDSWHVGAYALRQSGALALRLGAAYSQHRGESKRRVEFERFNDRPKGDYDADSQQAFVELGYNLGERRLNVEPFANLGYQRYHRDSYREKGGTAALAVDAQSQDNFSSTLGMRFAYLNQLDNGITLTPRASLGWRHVYGDVDSEVRQAFISGGTAFSVEGTALDRDSLMVEAGLGVGLSARHSINLGYNGELGSNSRNHGLSAQWQMRF